MNLKKKRLQIIFISIIFLAGLLFLLLFFRKKEDFYGFDPRNPSGKSLQQKLDSQKPAIRQMSDEEYQKKLENDHQKYLEDEAERTKNARAADNLLDWEPGHDGGALDYR